MAEAKNIICVCISVIASLSYCYFVSAKIPKGKYRFISLLPIFYLFTILPLHLSFILTRFSATLFITWLANFKLLLFCFNQGPLARAPPNSLLLFITIAALPSKLKQNRSVSKPKKKIPLNLATEPIVLALIVALLHGGRVGKYYVHPKIEFVLNCCLLFLIVDVLVGFSSKLVHAVVGLELDPPSDEPYLSTSLQDFWGKRWNLMITNILRETIYTPVRSGTTCLLGKDTAVFVAVLASFFVSGLMHEVMLYQLTRVKPNWEFGSFFLLHGVCVVAEIAVKRKRAVRGRWSLPVYVSRPLAVGFVMMTASWLFSPAMMNNGLDVKVVREFMLILEFVEDKLQLIYACFRNFFLFRVPKLEWMFNLEK